MLSPYASADDNHINNNGFSLQKVQQEEEEEEKETVVKGNVRRKFCESYLNRCHHSHACVMRFGKALCLLTTHCMELCTYCSV